MKKSQLPLLCCTAVFLCMMMIIFVARNVTTANKSILRDYPPTEATEASLIDGRININAAGVSELMLLPGIGEGIAQRILDYRRENGPFESVEDLLQIKGIGVTRLEDIQPFVTVGG